MSLKPKPHLRSPRTSKPKKTPELVAIAKKLVGGKPLTKKEEGLVKQYGKYALLLLV